MKLERARKPSPLAKSPTTDAVGRVLRVVLPHCTGILLQDLAAVETGHQYWSRVHRVLGTEVGARYPGVTIPNLGGSQRNIGAGSEREKDICPVLAEGERSAPSWSRRPPLKYRLRFEYL